MLVSSFHSDSKIYRPIALPTAASNLVELILHNRMSPYKNTSDAQFGFKDSHDTDMVIYFFKENVKIYLNSKQQRHFIG